MFKKIILFSILFISLWACGSDTCRDDLDISKIQTEVQIIRLEQEIFKLKTKSEIKAFLTKYKDFADKFYQLNRMKTDSVVIDAIFRMINTKEIAEEVYRDVQSQFAEMQALKNEFETAFKHLKYYYPDFKIPKIYTTITGLGSFLGNDLFVSEDMIVISLEFFLKKTKKSYRPPTELMPDYIWRRYTQASIVPTCVQYISNKYNQTDFADKTILAEMIYYGKAYQFVKTMMPCVPDSIMTGYTRVELANINDKANRDYIWNHFIDKKILFSTSGQTRQTYLTERPYVGEINSKCPGRIGQWLGWRIIQKYLKQNPDVSFRDLMSNKNAQDIFQNSGYKGD